MGKYLIGLDDGHGVKTAGKRTPPLKSDLIFLGKKRAKGTIIHENEFNENIMYLIQKGLDRCNLDHIQLAPGDSDISLASRVSKANRNRCDLVVSIHANALYGSYFQTKAYGLVVIHTANSSSTSVRLARNCYKHLKEEVDWYSNGGTKYGVRSDIDISGFTLYILRRTNMPAVLIEYGFMDNWEDLKRMVTSEFQEKCAEATVKGICETLKVKYIAPEEKKKVVKRIRVIRDVNYRTVPDFSKDEYIAGQAKVGEVFTVVDEVKSNGKTNMYKLKSGFYITTSPKYVEIYE